MWTGPAGPPAAAPMDLGGPFTRCEGMTQPMPEGVRLALATARMSLRADHHTPDSARSRRLHPAGRARPI
jgi:hypothetical protein